MTETHEPEENEAARCEHFWTSTHQPDFPKDIYWVEQCHRCGSINGAAPGCYVGWPHDVDDPAAAIRALKGQP